MSKRIVILTALLGVWVAFYIGYNLYSPYRLTLKPIQHLSNMDLDGLVSLHIEVTRLESLKNDLSALIKHGFNKIGEDNTDLQELKMMFDELANKAKQLGDTTSSNDGAVRMDDDSTLADKLYNEVRVLCWVLTAPKTLDTRAVAVKNTWGKRCNKLLFFSSVSNDTLPAIGLNTTEGRDMLTLKSSRAFRYVYKHHVNDYDWFMRIDDDGYVIMENLRYFLSSRDTEQPVYFGHHFKTIVKGGYFSGGPGIILGREALKRFGERSLDDSICAQQAGAADDAALGKCLYNFGVYAANTTDTFGRSRFHCFAPVTHVVGHYPGWFYAYDANGAHHYFDNSFHSRSSVPLFPFQSRSTCYTSYNVTFKTS